MSEQVDFRQAATALHGAAVIAKEHGLSRQNAILAIDQGKVDKHP